MDAVDSNSLEGLFAPLVMVRCLAYNHEAYIKDALNGFVMQQTNFPFVVVIVNDASPDNTGLVVEDFIRDNFEITGDGYYCEDADYAHIIHAYHKDNKNCLFYYLSLRINHFGKISHRPYYKKYIDAAKYWAECEGDDYWTDPLKLQKQVAYMEGHSDCCMSTHAAYFDVKGEWLKWGCQHKMECDLTPDEVIRNGGLYLATASLIYRKELLNDRPEWMIMADVGDYPLQILGTLRGTLHYFPEIMCVYRYQHSGSWTNNAIQTGLNVNHLKTEISWLNKLDEETDYQYSDAICFHLISFYSVLYRNKQISFNDYYRVFKKVPEHSYKRLRRDVLINSFHGLYDMYKKVITCKNS